ncbi:MAG: nucleotidyltransferase domain-containing protein [bacterium]
MASQETLDILRRYLSRIIAEGIPAKGLVLYGSRAKGRERPESDIDVIVLLDDGSTPREIDSIWTQLEHLTIRIDTRIETWPVTIRRFQTDEVSPLIILARCEGIPIAA